MLSHCIKLLIKLILITLNQFLNCLVLLKFWNHWSIINLNSSSQSWFLQLIKGNVLFVDQTKAFNCNINYENITKNIILNFIHLIYFIYFLPIEDPPKPYTLDIYNSFVGRFF